VFEYITIEFVWYHEKDPAVKGEKRENWGASHRYKKAYLTRCVVFYFFIFFILGVFCLKMKRVKKMKMKKIR